MAAYLGSVNHPNLPTAIAGYRVIYFFLDFEKVNDKEITVTISVEKLIINTSASNVVIGIASFLYR